MKKTNKILFIISIVATVLALIMNLVEKNKQNEINNCKHNWEMSTNVELCTYSGNVSYYCTYCQTTKTEYNTATGHNYGQYYSRWLGGCTTHTYNVYDCIYCDYEKITITDGDMIRDHNGAFENQYCYNCGFRCVETDADGNVLMFSSSFGYVAEYYTTVASWNFSHSKDELKAIYFSYSVETIADNAFTNATDLLCVDIPSTVTTIGSNAFGGCSNIRRVNVNADVSGVEQFANTSDHIFWITYYLENGTNHEDNPVVYSSISETITLKAPTREGYTFLGWTTSDSEEPVLSKTIPAGSKGDITLIANWQENETPSDPGETPSEPGETPSEPGETPSEPGETPSEPGETPSEPGETPSDPGETPSDPDETPSEPSIQTYAITYYLNEGVNHADNPSSYTGETAIVLKAPTKPGFTFVGWLGSGLSEPTLDVTIEAGSTGEKYYIATWTEIESYSITYNLNGGTNHVNNPASFKLDDANITLQNPTRGGYDFVGWFKESSFETKITTIETSSAISNVEIFAKWEALFTISGNTITGFTEYGNNANIKHLVIPGSIDGTAIYQVGHNAFSGNTLYSVVIEEGVRKISSSAFYYCCYLTSIKLPSTLTTITSGAFYGCYALAEVYNLSSIDLENEGEIMHYAIVIKTDWQEPSSIQEIDGVFYYIENETSYVAIGAVDRSATSISLHEKTTKIKKYAFEGCSFEQIELSDNLTEIGEYAFCQCSKLSQIVIPSSVTTIAGDAFCACYNLIIYAEVAEKPAGWVNDSYNWNSSDCLVFWYSESQPTLPGNWWHYVSGEIVVW